MPFIYLSFFSKSCPRGLIITVGNRSMGRPKHMHLMISCLIHAENRYDYETKHTTGLEIKALSTTEHFSKLHCSKTQKHVQQETNFFTQSRTPATSWEMYNNINLLQAFFHSARKLRADQ